MQATAERSVKGILGKLLAAKSKREDGTFTQTGGVHNDIFNVHLPGGEQEEGERPIPKGVGFDKCVDRMGRAGADDPAALCAWMWDEDTGYFASGEQECGEACEKCEARKAAMARYSDRGEAAGSTAQGALLRGKSKRKVESMVSLAEAMVDRKTRSVRCTVIREGGGNRRDRHWYGPEAIEKIAQLINGAKAHINHPTEAEAKARPEGDLWGLAGFWKDGTIIEVEGRRAVMATLVCDTSEAGEAALSKAEHAIEYAKEFPGLEEVYAGISINGDGETEPREIEGQDWNYVVDVTELPRADVVTRPAREGKFLALVESIRSADPKEAREMANKAVKGELTKIAEATAALDEDQDPKKSVGMIEGAVARLKALFKEAFPPKEEDESENETEDEAAKKKAAASEKREDETEDESETKDESEDEAMRADDAAGDEDEDEDAEEEPEKKGSKSVVHIKHEEKRTTAESARALRDARKELKEAQATIAKLTKKLAVFEVKELTEAGLPKDFAEALQDLPAPQRKAMRALAGMLNDPSSDGFAGSTVRGTSVKESKPGDGFMKLLESDGGRS